MENDFWIVTPRLVLRPWREDDRPVFRGYVSDATMMEYITGGEAWSEETIDAFFARQARHLDERGYCVGAVEQRGSGEVIGVAGLQPQTGSGDDELAWWIARERQGHGFASEIGSACLRYGLDVLRRPRIVAIAHPDNLASIRVMQKIGMRYLDTASAHALEPRYPDEPVTRYVAESLQQVPEEKK